MKRPTAPDHLRTAVIIVSTIFAALLLFRVHPGMALTFSVFALGGAIGYFLLGTRLSDLFGESDDAKAQDPFHRRIAERIDDCRQREERFRDEGERILRSMTTLRDDLARSDSFGEVEVARAEATVKELEAEFNLRYAKAAFFADCARKLEELRDRHHLVQSIAARRKELRDLQQRNFDDEAVVEETRYGIEQDGIELDTIVELSNSAFSSSKADQTEELRRRLEKLRGALDRP